MTMAITDGDRRWLARCVELAEEALDNGDGPFGSVLVDGEDTLRAEGRNREVSGGDETRHPELELAQWAARNMSAAERAAATLYTSGEHCAMCSAAQGWVGVGRLVFVMSTPQLVALQAELGRPAGPVAPLRASEVAVDVEVLGPEPSLVEAVAELHRRALAG
ncbi:nucleoside deaminase [Pseudactinotalea sp.]|uniref:nucleoside deaminase n=1 Tax=Pseudactinotalea sp. TaxID=1926260 RepID=UPI003B3BABE1